MKSVKKRWKEGKENFILNIDLSNFFYYPNSLHIMCMFRLYIITLN